MNRCFFSTCRRYRYSLVHQWDELITTRSRVMWVGLNPSTADEQNLDPTLRRIRYFSSVWGFNEFVMTNLFAFRATNPKEMLAAFDPIGPGNDAVLLDHAEQSECVILCWGANGDHLGRSGHVASLLQAAKPGQVFCLGNNRDGSPKHPLYLHHTAQRKPMDRAA